MDETGSDLPARFLPACMNEVRTNELRFNDFPGLVHAGVTGKDLTPKSVGTDFFSRDGDQIRFKGCGGIKRRMSGRKRSLQANKRENAPST